LAPSSLTSGEDKPGLTPSLDSRGLPGMLLDKVSRAFNFVALPKFITCVTSSVTTKPSELRPFSVLGQQAMRVSRLQADIRIPVF
jgi:hypothetical protein